jgi:hypothetical protein
MHYAVAWQGDNEVLVDIEFDELLMEGTGYLAERVPCFGQMRLFLDRQGRVIRCEIL